MAFLLFVACGVSFFSPIRALLWWVVACVVVVRRAAGSFVVLCEYVICGVDGFCVIGVWCWCSPPADGDRATGGSAMDWVRCEFCHADLEFGVAVLDGQGNWVCPTEMLEDCLADMLDMPVLTVRAV